jgi:hypothetical protein
MLMDLNVEWPKKHASKVFSALDDAVQTALLDDAQVDFLSAVRDRLSNLIL